MSVMGKIEGRMIDWFAVRYRIRNNPGRTTCVLGADYESYRDRQGRPRKRRLANTGERVFVPELLARRAGFEVFLPVRKDWRRRNQFSPERKLQSFPLMPGWMFVGWPAGENRWQDLMALDIVAGVMGTGGRPLRISEQKMTGLMRQWGGGRLAPGLKRYMRVGHEFEAGDVMQIAYGPFEGMPAKVVDIDGAETRVLVDIFGKDIPATLATECLERS
ncbi:MAG: transcription termination/antitermination NusG family protein [Paracoccaceae bacterium]